MAQKSFELPEITGLSLPSLSTEAESLGSVSPRNAAGLFAVPSQSSARRVSQPAAPDPQMSDLRAVVERLASSATESLLRPRSSTQVHHISSPSAARKHRLALNELDLLCRIRAGYAFTELTPELQEAVLSLIASRHLTTPEIDLAFWLEDLRLDPTLSNSVTC